MAYSGGVSYTNNVEQDWYGNTGLSVYVPKNVKLQVAIGLDIHQRITAFQKGVEPFPKLENLANLPFTQQCLQ